ncbi:glycine zipper 2TM domain-containing protein [Methyloversatilis sp.]|uniref:glycine zipper 2TM domain-containing protein n=1 Tax=Methyloversatilis sp. TaxID=2569862 RepID=UPI002732CD01|nr:glycine zipper 2TM domain-containing protein [Methyloversatilis sp.]MDP2869971.1 glycine zipper 2TM domain-containing protein [Methyloversatilis sp.]MDP3290361.1 glycine zipper 2TM domain-containing protein [Methyloversatilis sp.]MDP3454559.1 glycine zipper 2TM domain-containing protein [Methyloversatilis sp.]MDP3576476.1 glycine zipper 2TM domain-containing protein [Methyloversatilis sp.]
MNTLARTASARSLHPALWVAALSITAFSAVGIASMTGMLERSPAPAPIQVVAAASVDPLAATAVAPVAPVAEQPAVTQAPAKSATAERPVVVAQPRKPELTQYADARPVRVADRTYDPGIDITAAPQRDIDQPIDTSRAASNRIENDYRSAPTPLCIDCGIIESIREVQAAADPSGLGAAAGGVVGGLLGNNVGKGSGRTVATIIGIAGGAYAGHQIEKTQRKTTRYELGVRMNNGDYRTVTLDAAPNWHVGDKVKLQNGNLVQGD